MDMSMLPALPPEPGATAASIAGVRFAGPSQEDLGAFFVCAVNGVATYGDDWYATIGDPRVGPHHFWDGFARDFSLLPEDLTSTSLPMGVCCVRENLPGCQNCGQPARYDIWATAWRGSLVLCLACAAPLGGQELGYGSATYIYTLDEISSRTRSWCDAITAEMGRPSLWAVSSVDASGTP